MKEEDLISIINTNIDEKKFKDEKEFINFLNIHRAAFASQEIEGKESKSNISHICENFINFNQEWKILITFLKKMKKKRKI